MENMKDRSYHRREKGERGGTRDVIANYETALGPRQGLGKKGFVKFHLKASILR